MKVAKADGKPAVTISATMFTAPSMKTMQMNSTCFAGPL